jgi:hypothetical protein
LETFVTGSEKEAALLENQLIKAHQPRYNVKLKDDKDFLSLRINPAAPWPRIDVVRRPRKDGASYYGPYHSATAARQTLRLVNRHFQLRTCTDAELARRVRPCLQYQIKRCPAPCVLDVPREAYLEQVRDVGLFLSGRHDELVKHLERRMGEASRALDFEQAAVFRDQLRAVSRVQEEQRVTSCERRGPGHRGAASRGRPSGGGAAAHPRGQAGERAHLRAARRVPAGRRAPGLVRERVLLHGQRRVPRRAAAARGGRGHGRPRRGAQRAARLAREGAASAARPTRAPARDGA